MNSNKNNEAKNDTKEKDKNKNKNKNKEKLSERDLQELMGNRAYKRVNGAIKQTRFKKGDRRE